MELRNLLRPLKQGEKYTDKEKNAIAKWFQNHRPVNEEELEYQRAIQQQLGVKVPGVNNGYFPMGAKIGGRHKRSTHGKHSKHGKPSKRTTRRYKK